MSDLRTSIKQNRLGVKLPVKELLKEKEIIGEKQHGFGQKREESRLTLVLF